MNFKEKYTNAIEKDNKKVLLSNDAYALGEVLSELLNRIESLRLSL